MKIIFIFLIIFVFLLSFTVYKYISKELKKTSKTQQKIMKECKTEDERKEALRNLKRKNIKKSLIFYFALLIGLPVICFLLLILLRTIPHTQIKPIGSYELFNSNGISYYGKHDYSIFCYNNGSLAFSTYKIFDKKNKTVFETNSYEKFLSKLEDMFKNTKIEKINFYGTCLSDPGYKSLGYALKNSKLIDSHEVEEIKDGQLIHIKTVNGILIKIEYLWDDMICTCKGA